MVDIRELYARRVEAASIALGRGDRPEGERLFTEALAMGEEHFGASDPALALPLNELSRLYVRRAEHARAEPLLQRLLEIRRASGENHPDVATVLAALAAVRRGLGDDVGAESLYRHALQIREKVHAPEHMAVVVTLEQLAETCAAMGKHGDARPLLERALAAREKALGTSHPATNALRARLAEPAARPELPKAPNPVVAPAAAAAPAEVPGPNQLVFIYEPEKPVRRSSIRRDRVMTPPFSAAVAAASLISVPALATAPPHAPAPIELAVTSLVFADPRELKASIRPRAEEGHVARAAAPRRSQRVSAPARANVTADRPTKSAKRYALAAGGVGATAMALFIGSSRFERPTPTSEPAPLASEAFTGQPANVNRAPAAAVVAAPMRPSAARADTTRLSNAKPVAVAQGSSSPRSAAPADPRLAVAALPFVPDIGGVSIPEMNAPNADSVLRASTTRRDVDNDQIGSAGRLRAPTITEDHVEASPVLVGAIPQPRFPDALRAQRIEGVVVVRFLVGTDGSVDPSTMKVVRSPHELFTSAVRSVLPKLRFQPARSADARPRTEWVQYSIEFSAAK